MININFTGYSPGFYQSDRSYNQPSITGAVQWNGNNKKFEVSNGSSWIPIDNTIVFHADIDIYKISQWVKGKMEAEEREKELRKKYPALDQAYKDLEFIKGMIAEE